VASTGEIKRKAFKKDCTNTSLRATPTALQNENPI